MSKFELTAENIADFRAQQKTATRIARERDVDTALVVYHLRKLADPEIEKILKYNASKSHIEFEIKRPRIEQMIRDGVPSLDIINEMKISVASLTRLRKTLGIPAKNGCGANSNRKKVVIELAQKVCDELKDYGWFSASSVYQKFGVTLREFCGVLKHINLHGVGEYSIERESGSNHPKWRFVEQVKLGSTSIRITKTDKSGFWLLATAPVPMRYVSNFSA